MATPVDHTQAPNGTSCSLPSAFLTMTAPLLTAWTLLLTMASIPALHIECLACHDACVRMSSDSHPFLSAAEIFGSVCIRDKHTCPAFQQGLCWGGCLGVHECGLLDELPRCIEGSFAMMFQLVCINPLQLHLQAKHKGCSCACTKLKTASAKIVYLMMFSGTGQTAPQQTPKTFQNRKDPVCQFWNDNRV